MLKAFIAVARRDDRYVWAFPCSGRSEAKRRVEELADGPIEWSSSTIPGPGPEFEQQTLIASSGDLEITIIEPNRDWLGRKGSS